MTRLSLALLALAIALPRPQSNLSGRSFAIASGAVVELRDIPGPIYITAGEVQSIQVRIRSAANPSGASLPQLQTDERADRIAIYGTPSGLDDGRRLELHLRLPAAIRLNVQRIKGELRVDGGLQGALTVSDVAGAIQATVKGLEPVRISNVSGSVKLHVDAERGRRDISIDRVAGSIAVVTR